MGLKQKLEDEVNRLYRSAGYWLFVVAFVILLNGLFLGLAVGDPAHRGTFGDQFGFANACFSGVSVVGLILTLQLQQIQFQLTRDDDRKKTTLELYKEWHGETLLNHRFRAGEWIKSLHPDYQPTFVMLQNVHRGQNLDHVPYIEGHLSWITRSTRTRSR